MRHALLVALAVLTSASVAFADDAEAEYTRVINQRADDVLKVLKLGDSTRERRVHDLLTAHYRALRDWQEASEPIVKDASASPEAKERALAERKTLGERFVAKLEAELSPADVEKVKDKLTYDVAPITYAGFLDMLPDLTETQKEKIKQMLLEAREEALVGVSSKEKHAIFGKYKGRINNYLSKEGYDLKQASKDWAERRKAREVAAKQSTAE